MTVELHVGDIGTVITATVTDDATGDVVNLASATTLTMRLRKPSKSVVEWTAGLTTDGSDGKVSYTTVDGDLDQAGAWKFQLYVVLPAGEWYSSIQPMDVVGNLT